MDNLCLNWDILDSLSDDVLCNIFNDSLLDDIGDVLNLIFYGIIVLDDSLDWDSLSSDYFVVFSDHSLDWDGFDSLNLFVNDFSLFVWDVLDSTFSWDFFNDSFVVDGGWEGQSRCS